MLYIQVDCDALSTYSVLYMSLKGERNFAALLS